MMKDKRIKVLLITVFGGFLLLFLIKLFAILSFPENKNIVRIERAFPTMDSSYPKTKPIKLYPDKPITQKIVASQNNFSQINIAFDNFPKYLGDKIILTLGDENCAPLHSRSIGFFSFWRDTIFTRFAFPPLPDSAGKTYCLQAELKLKRERSNDLPRILTFRSENDSIFNSGEKGGKTFNRQSLLFKSAYSEGSVSKNISTLIGRMSQYKPPFFKGLALEILLFLSFASIIALVFIFVLLL